MKNPQTSANSEKTNRYEMNRNEQKFTSMWNIGNKTINVLSCKRCTSQSPKIPHNVLKSLAVTT